MINKILENKFFLLIAICLIFYGLARPNLADFLYKSKPNTTNIDRDISAPKDPKIKEVCEEVINVLKSGPSSRKNDGIKLSSLYTDLANLVSLDGDDQVIKSTLEIREANKLSGIMLQLDLNGKYSGLSSAANNVIVSSLGSDDVVLDQQLRTKAVEAFRALAWACYQGSK